MNESEIKDIINTALIVLGIEKKAFLSANFIINALTIGLLGSKRHSKTKSTRYG
jgi:hypothetical protein